MTVSAVEVTDVVILNDAVVAPAGIITVCGTFAYVLLADRLTMAPPVGAGPLMVAVPITEVPPWTEVGDTEIDESVGASPIVSVAVKDA